MLKFDFIYKTIFFLFFLFTFAKRIDFYKFILKKYSNSNFIFNKKILQIIIKKLQIYLQKNFSNLFTKEIILLFLLKTRFLQFYSI